MDWKAIYISLGKGAETAIGASRWFGYPDLPADVEIPYVEEDGERYALTLICQINLADLHHEHLPHCGLLLFFADVAYYGGDWDEPAISMYPSSNRVCRVVYIPGERMAELESTRDRFVEQDEAAAIPITFRPKPLGVEAPDLQLFGTCSHLEWQTWPEPCEGWQLFLQMDSMEGPDYNYNFIDCGVLCFIIDPEALSRLDFSNVRAIILST